MTGGTHGRGRQQRRARRTETIQVTHLLPKRIVSIPQRLPLMSTDESLWIRAPSQPVGGLALV